MTIDPRLSRRRQAVAEDRARRNVGRLLKFLILPSVLGLGVWLLLSPVLAVTMVDVAGVVESDTHAILAREGLLAGKPMVGVRSSRIEEALLTDPWIAEADVRTDWPNSVSVVVKERVPVAWVEVDGQWSRYADDGAALPSNPQPDSLHGRLIADNAGMGAETEEVALLGGIEFLSNLPSQFAVDAEVRIDIDGEFWCNCSGFSIRLGRPQEMASKARALAALLETDLSPGTTINLTAPSHPAVVPPQPPPAGTDQEQDSEADTGEEGDQSDL